MLNKDFDLLQIDIEGLEQEVIKSIDFKTIKPKKIRFECAHLNQTSRKELKDFLNLNGYIECYDVKLGSTCDPVWTVYSDYLEANREELKWNTEHRWMNQVFERRID